MRRIEISCLLNDESDNFLAMMMMKMTMKIENEIRIDKP